MKPGGTKGGDILFIWGLGILLLGFGAYLFLDSVRVVAGQGGGMISGLMRGRGGMGGAIGNGISGGGDGGAGGSGGAGGDEG